ncbi:MULTISPECIES: permease-like cell division protein FtsX [unclassified Thalassotalea]|uniref:permease-like cell division protein FtsX n=1 Tax=unclassified Thalassotalea TaxID=2614972 RepID=UPI0010814A48|nr:MULTISPECIES: permease-like cell division protein FtsX [unclassified Thalassotalea]NMP16260.1 cell division protein FtsX [Thalassotalea sp. Y01]QBY04303.1 cell division protein FtsX [Thalassotalea sp. HSM 43]
MNKDNNTFRKRSAFSFNSLIMLPVRHLQQATGSLGALWRTPMASIMTILVLGISLTLPATLHLFTKNAQQVSTNWESAAQISVFLKLNTNDKSAQNVVNRIRLYPEVDKVKYISAEQGLAEFKALSGFGKALTYLDENPLPATILVTPNERYSQPNAAKALLEKIEKEREVAQGKLDLEWLTRLEAIMSLVQDIVTSLAILLSLSVVLIIGNTIRLAILNQRSAIAVMKMVGATDAFIQRPFMYTGFWYGVFGGLLAALTVALLAAYLDIAIIELAQLYDSQFSLQSLDFSETMTLILTAIVLGLLGSYISVRQHIRDIEPSAE